MLAIAGIVVAQPASAFLTGQNPASPQSASRQNGPSAFDWDIGTWKTHQRRLLHPLTGSTTWVDYYGTDTVNRIWDGANSGLVEANGPAGHLEIFTLRLYNPETRQWAITFTTKAGGTLGTPVIGQFSNGRGEFFDQESYNGREIFVRFSVSQLTPTSCVFEQAFSTNGGRTWETNLVVNEQKVARRQKVARAWPVKWIPRN